MAQKLFTQEVYLFFPILLPEVHLSIQSALTAQLPPKGTEWSFFGRGLGQPGIFGVPLFALNLLSYVFHSVFGIRPS